MTDYVKHAPLVFVALLTLGGCASWTHWRSAPTTLPTRNSLVLDQLVVFSDTPLPEHHRLLDELRVQRSLLATKLALPTSDEPIHVYLFPTSERLDAFMSVQFPALPKRRAFFVESDTRLSVYAHWGDRVAEDLRHEVAHGYLHAVVPRLPLWLDEGLAEYFEVPRGMNGANRAHIEQLNDDLARGWRPNLRQLERLRETGEMTQREYAESWAWVHFLLETSPERRQLLQGYLLSLRGEAPVEPLSTRLPGVDTVLAQQMVEHLKRLRQSLQ